MSTPRTFLDRLTPVLGHGLFWSWNVIFLCVAYLGFLPFIAVDLFVAVWEGHVPPDFALFTILLLLCPLACTLFGARFLLHEPRKLLRLLFAIEGPLLMLTLLRLFAVRELTPGVAQLLLTFYLGAGFFLYELLRGVAPPERRGLLLTQLAGQTVLVIAGLYAAAALSFYAPPITVAFLRAFFRFEWLGELLRTLTHHPSAFFLLAGGMSLFGYALVLIAGSPLMLIGVAIGSFRRVYRAAAAVFGFRAAALAAALVALWLGIFAALQQQPQQRAFALLKDPPKTDAERAARLAAVPVLRDGLRNAYLASYRYLEARGADHHLRDIYRDLHLPLGDAVQALSLQVFAPALYQGESFAADMGEAERRYGEFFDQPIQRGERASVLRALEATYNQDDRQAGLLNQGQRKVWIEQQELTVQRDGDRAELLLHEVYRNQTKDQQEIFYYFSLPESAAVTGLWLGTSPDRAKADVFTVAPRGAAQRVYQAEVQRRRDPALLEQIGPRQYRLRAFPVPEREYHDRPGGLAMLRGEIKSATPMHLWLRVQVLAQGADFPLPRLTERRNVFWTPRSQRSIDGARRPASDDDWLPATVPGAGPPRAHEVTLATGVRVSATPATEPAPPLRGKHLAVIVDRSYSMRRVEAELKSALDSLRGGENQVDVYLGATATRGEAPQLVPAGQPLPPGATLGYGGGDLGELLAQQRTLAGDREYHGAIVLTDEGSLDLARDREADKAAAAALRPRWPLWIVHLGGQLAPGYDDATLAAVQRSGGGVTTNLADALAGLGRGVDNPIYDGYRFTVTTTSPAASGEPADSGETAFAALAARQFIVTRTRALMTGAAAELDDLHRVAVRYGVVSAYSSMIVLVNDEQRKRLEEESKGAQRFDRRVESGVEALSKNAGPFHVSAAPEPGEWLLLFFSMGALWYARGRRAAAAVVCAALLGQLAPLHSARADRLNPCAAVRCAAGTTCVATLGRARCQPVATPGAPGAEILHDLDACAAVRCAAGTQCRVVKGMARCEAAAVAPDLEPGRPGGKPGMIEQPNEEGHAGGANPPKTPVPTAPPPTSPGGDAKPAPRSCAELTCKGGFRCEMMNGAPRCLHRTPRCGRAVCAVGARCEIKDGIPRCVSARPADPPAAAR